MRHESCNLKWHCDITEFKERRGKVMHSFRCFQIIVLILSLSVSGMAWVGVMGAESSVDSPAPAFTYSPSKPVTMSPVSFDGSSSTCSASPCSYRWTDDADHSQLGMGVTMSFTFQDPGTKYVRLTITDAQSRSASVEHNVIVSQP